MATASASSIHREMQALGDPVRAVSLLRFFKTGPGQYGEGDRFLGLTLPILRRLVREHQDLPLAEVRALLASRWHEERLLALLILVRQYGRADARKRGAVYRLYLRNTRYINSWDLVDASAEHIVGAHLREGGRSVLMTLAASPSVWERRIAIIATFHYIKRGEFRDTLRIARVLLGDRHDLIHKAVGWMLREVGKRDQAVEETFLRQHAGRMPRTALRYAIERFPERLRRQYMGYGRA